MSGAVVQAIRSDPAAANLAVLPGSCLAGEGDLVMFDVAREGANSIIRALTDLGVERAGSISLTESDIVIGREATAAEVAALGHPSDGVVWSAVEEQARSDARLSWSFLAFLILATLIAGIGRYLDQPILIIGAMVVGPEFAPLAAICIGIVRARPRLIGPAIATLLGGFLIAAAFAYVVWASLYANGVITFTAATTGPATQFIIQPDAWSFAIALLAGCAGMLSLTSAKSSALVGVFISVTTVPAVGTVALTLAVGAADEALASTMQLGLNLLGLIIGGVTTLVIQSILTRTATRRRS